MDRGCSNKAFFFWLFLRVKEYWEKTHVGDVFTNPILHKNKSENKVTTMPLL